MNNFFYDENTTKHTQVINFKVLWKACDFSEHTAFTIH